MPARKFMPTILPLTLIFLLTAAAGDGAPTSTPATQPATRPAAPSEAEIQRMIRQLNHPVHSRRRAAIRQLAEWGPVTFPQLRRAAESSDVEMAISARDLLREFESAVMIGAQVWIEVDRPRVAWDEPFTVIIHATNPTGERIEVPWPANTAASLTPEATAATTQPAPAATQSTWAATQASGPSYPPSPPLAKGGPDDRTITTGPGATGASPPLNKPGPDSPPLANSGPDSPPLANRGPDSPPLNKGGLGGVNDVAQVAAMMDASDFLIVTGPDGQPIDLRAEPIERDAQVYAAVQLRAGNRPPTHPLPPGQSDQLTIPSFNRGWARFPMLTSGRYTLTFSYQPDWSDPSWTREGFGLVRSAPVTIEITAPAPETIQTGELPVCLVLKRDGDKVVAELQSTWDRAFWINLNFGDNLRTHALLDWRLNANEDGADSDALHWQPELPLEPFTADRLHLLQPGEHIAIGRAPIAALRELLKQAAHPPDRLELIAKYVNLPTAAQIREEAADKGQSPEVPTQLFSGSVSSEPLALDP